MMLVLSGCGNAGQTPKPTGSFTVGHSGRHITESVGIETVGGVFTPLIENGTELPARFSDIFSTASDDQPSVELHILVGDGKMAAENRSVGRFSVAGIRPAPRGVPRIEVSFAVTEAGVVTVAARDTDTGKANEITITGLDTEKE